MWGFEFKSRSSGVQGPGWRGAGSMGSGLSVHDSGLRWNYAPRLCVWRAWGFIAFIGTAHAMCPNFYETLNLKLMPVVGPFLAKVCVQEELGVRVNKYSYN